MAEDRLLTREELQKIRDEVRQSTTEGSYASLSDWTRAILKAQDISTLKAVGVWLGNKLRVSTMDLSTHYDIQLSDVEALKRGEWPG